MLRLDVGRECVASGVRVGLVHIQLNEMDLCFRLLLAPLSQRLAKHRTVCTRVGVREGDALKGQQATS